MRPAPLALALAALCGCAPGRPGAAVVGGGPRRLIVDARALLPEADGSRERPFKTVGAALAAARDGDTVALRTGLYSERVRVERAVTLTGPRSAVIAAPEAGDTAVELLAPSRLEGLSVQGGAIGVRVATRATLRGLSFSGQRRAGVRVVSGRAEVTDCALSALLDLRELVAIGVDPGAELAALRVSIEGPFRWGVEARGGSFELDQITVENAVGGVLCTEGCRGKLRGSQLSQGRGAGALCGSGSRLEARDNLVSRWEQCFVASGGAELVLDDNTTAFCELESVAAVGSRLEVRHHLHTGRSRTAGITVIGGRALIEESALLDPGAVGLLVRGGEAEARGLLVRGARADADGTFGDGVFAISQGSLRLEQPFLEANEGAGLTAQNGPAVVLGLEAHGNALAGVEAQHRAQVRLVGPSVSGSSGPGLLAIEASRIEADWERLRDNGGGAAWARCEEGASIELERTEGQSSCVTRRGR